MFDPKRFAKSIVQRGLSQFGLQLRRLPEASFVRNSASGVFASAVSAGLAPRTVIDVGVADGTPALYEAFPTAHLVLIEPLQEYRATVEAIAGSRPGSELAIAAASRAAGRITLNVHPDLFGSSLYREDEDSDVNGVERSVECLRLDDFCRSRATVGPYLIKVDVQGAELDVLAGATGLLEETEMICLEVSLFEFFAGAPQFPATIEQLRQYGFVPYDLYDPQYRPLDGAMSQIDIAFVREDGALRRFHHYATRQQRAIHNALARRAAPGAARLERAPARGAQGTR